MLNSPMSSPQMIRMFGFFCADATSAAPASVPMISGGFWVFSGRKVLRVVGGTGWVTVEGGADVRFQNKGELLSQRRAVSSE